MNWRFINKVDKGDVKFSCDIPTSTIVNGFRIGIKSGKRSYIHRIVKSWASDTDNADIIDKLNHSYTSFRFDYLVGIIALILLVILNCVRNPYNIIWESIVSIGVIIFYKFKLEWDLECNEKARKLFIFGSLICIYIVNSLTKNYVFALIGIMVFIVVVLEMRRRHVNIEYEFKDNADYYQVLIAAFNKMKKSKYIWIRTETNSEKDMDSYTIIDGYEWWEQDGIMGSAKLPWVNTNIVIPSIEVNDNRFYFVPDGIIVYYKEKVKWFEYKELDITNHKKQVETNWPIGGAKVVGQTWAETKMDGTPDMRYKINPELYICEYDILRIESSGEFLISIETSLADGTKEFREAICNIQTNI